MWCCHVYCEIYILWFYEIYIFQTISQNPQISGRLQIQTLKTGLRFIMHESKQTFVWLANNPCTRLQSHRTSSQNFMVQSLRNDYRHLTAIPVIYAKVFQCRTHRNENIYISQFAAIYWVMIVCVYRCVCVCVCVCWFIFISEWLQTTFCKWIFSFELVVFFPVNWGITILK